MASPIRSRVRRGGGGRDKPPGLSSVVLGGKGRGGVLLIPDSSPSPLPSPPPRAVSAPSTGLRPISGSAPVFCTSLALSWGQLGHRGGNAAAAALLSPPPGCPGSVPQSRSASQAGVATSPGQRPRTGARERLRSLGAFFLGRVGSPARGGPRPRLLKTFAAPPIRSGHAERSHRFNLSPAGQAQPQPPSCRSSRSGRREGTGSEILDRSPRPAPQGSEGREEVWNGVFHPARPH
ncbi:hypothetical protein NDU88_004417 [Pleurodeles waltl]|uniref:Uncharacterized protein n=1 Tax=Pleurodeles waltl TaxID=8319 RepID=A0AAV7UJ19_PLEWA|nr:hypothetical protein NDU88_004417 [Pleurodeles waltl]